MPEIRGAGARKARGAWAPIRTPMAACCCSDLVMPDFRDYAVEVPQARRAWMAEATRVMGSFLRDVMKLNAGSAQLPRVRARTRPPPTAWTRCSRSPTASPRREILPTDDHISPRRPRDGGAERAHVPGLAGRLSAHRPARLLLLLRGLHPHHRFHVQPARQVAEGHAPHSVAAAHRLAELPAHFARLAAGPQRLQPPGPGLHRPRGEQEGRRRARLSAARRQHAALGHRPLPAQPQLRQRDRGRQAAGAAVARHGGRHRALHRRASASGTGPATTRARSPTW